MHYGKMSRLEKASHTGEVIRSDAAYTALTMDIICQYAFASDDNYLMEDDFRLVWKENLTMAFEKGALQRQFPWLPILMNSLPPAWLEVGMPQMKPLFQWKYAVRECVKSILSNTEPAPTSGQNKAHRTIFHELRDSNLPADEKTLDRLCDEAQIFTGAGSETTAQTLATITFYLLESRDKLHKLQAELKTIMPNPNNSVSWSKVEQLPYLVILFSSCLYTAPLISGLVCGNK
jgi:cytochrome P450